MRFPTKIPTLVGILFIIVLIVGISVIFEGISRGISRASVSPKPKGVVITNISDTSFTATWTTADPATGAISIVSPKERVVFDERDASGKLGKYLNHSVTVRSLQPATSYSFKIISGGKPFLTDNQPFQVRTAPPLSAPGSELEPAYGTVVAANNQPVEGALVFLTLEGGQTLSTLTKPSGSWLIPLNLARTEDLAQYLPSGERVTETLLVRSGSAEASAITDTLNDSPVPTMVLGKTYDFRRQQAKTTPETPLATTTTFGSGNILGTQTKREGKVSITAPANGAILTTNLPLIAGTGVGGNSVTVTVGITKPISGTTIIGADGIWRFTPPKPLTSGKQSVTITTNDATGKPVALTHIFEILKSGTQVLGEATPSATPTATASPTLSPTLEPTPVSTLSGEPLPVSGSTLPTLLLIILSLGLLTSGVVVFVK